MHSKVFEDNNGAFGLDTSPSTTPRMHHIAVKCHFFREHAGEVKGVMIQRVKSKYHESGVFKKRINSRNIPVYKKVTGRVTILIIRKQGRDKRTKYYLSVSLGFFVRDRFGGYEYPISR